MTTPTVAERRSRAQSPILASPGYDRAWVPERIKPTRYNRKRRWSVGLLSRTDTLLGYIAENDIGWGAFMIVRGKSKCVGGLGYSTPQAAADVLLKARKAKK